MIELSSKNLLTAEAFGIKPITPMYGNSGEREKLLSAIFDIIPVVK